MKAKQGVIEILNKVLTADLTAINQYFVHAKMCSNWGYERLHHKVRERSIDEMKDADELISHILYLEGVPNVQRMNTVHVGDMRLLRHIPERPFYLFATAALGLSGVKLLWDGVMG